ncbi:MAG: ArsO family NAD(P)H-dependent flavin-containing monooxygenase [Rheinheimera sp.]
MAIKIFDVVIIGGGQAALSAGYYLRRAGLDFIILDNQATAGGAWNHTWPSLRLFSPALYSSLPGILFSTSKTDVYPHRNDVIAYLERYETRYQLPIFRPHHVKTVLRDKQHNCLKVSDGKYSWLTRTIISATGNWSHPVIPVLPGAQTFQGEQCHSAYYQGPERYQGKIVLVVGGGNSGAQIFAELDEVATATWVTREPPKFLADDVDGRVLFERATARINGQAGSATTDLPIGGIGDIVMVPPVKAARERGVLKAKPLFSHFTANGVVWQDGSEQEVDAVIWCTGFQPELQYLDALDIVEADGKVMVQDGQSAKEPRVWCFGYGDWTSPGSATLIGAGRSARDNIPKLVEFLKTGG